MGFNETLKEYGKKVKENPTLLLIPAGVLGGLYLLFVPKAPEMTEPPLARESEGQPIGGGGSGGGMDSGMDSVLSEVMASMDAQNKAFSEAFNDLANQFASYQSNTNKQLGEVFNGFDALSEQFAQAPMIPQAFDERSFLDRLPGIYFDGRHDGEQYESIRRNVRREEESGTFTRDLSESVLNRIAGVGNNAVGGTAEEWKNNLSRLSNDRDYASSELDRARRVIQNRRSEGLDTSKQEEYIRIITGGN